jgi:uncharacterized membrane protein (DUF485 family)
MLKKKEYEELMRKRRREARANAVLTLALPLIAAGAGAFLGAILGGTVIKR